MRRKNVSINAGVKSQIELTDEQREFIMRTKDFVKEKASEIWSNGDGTDEEDLITWCLQDMGKALERLLETGNPCE